MLVESLDEVTEKTTIKFGKPLTQEGIEDLLLYIAKEMPANINYNASYHRSLLRTGHGIRGQKGSVTVSAQIVGCKNPLAFDCFESILLEGDSSKISAIAFNRVPGWELHDYRQEVRALWGQVREVVGRYFSQEII